MHQNPSSPTVPFLFIFENRRFATKSHGLAAPVVRQGLAKKGTSQYKPFWLCTRINNTDSIEQNWNTPLVLTMSDDDEVLLEVWDLAGLQPWSYRTVGRLVGYTTKPNLLRPSSRGWEPGEVQKKCAGWEGITTVGIDLPVILEI